MVKGIWQAIAAALALSLAASAEVRLTGRVVDENSAAIAGARVFVSKAGAPAALPLQATTDLTGAFAVALPAPGDYVLSAEREGYFRLQERQVTLMGADNEITLVLNLTREVFERVSVSYSPPAIDFDRTTTEQRITGTQLIQVPFPTTNNLRNAMRLLPGMVQDQRGGIHLNGGTEEQVLYTLDGFNLNDPLTGRFESRISVEAVRSLEVSSGNPSAEFGKGSAGLLAVKTTTGDDKIRYAGTNFIPGVENRKGLVIGNWTPRFNLSGPLRRGRAWFSDTFDVRYDKHIEEDLPEGEDRISSWRFNNLLRTQFNLTPSNILYVGSLFSFWSAPRTGLSVLDPLETTVDRRSRQWFFHFKDQIYLGRGAILEAGYAANRTFGREIPQGGELLILTPEGRRGNYFVDGTRKAGRDQWLANLFLPSFHAFGSHQLKAGLDLDRVSYWQDVRRTGYEQWRADLTRSRKVVFGGSGRFDRPTFEASSYLQDSWRLRSSLFLELGLRQDWDALAGNTRFSPRLGVSWAPPGTENTKLSGGFAVVYDVAYLRLFTRPQDQYSLASYYMPDGQLVRGPAVSVFTIGGERLETPRYYNWNVAMEQRLAAGIYARLGYLQRRGRDGFTYRNILASSVPPPPQLAAALPASVFDAVYELGNLRRDVYDAFELTARQTFLRQYEWMASYTRSRAHSNAVADLSIDDPVIVSDNVGPMPWDAPNRVVSWGYLPMFRRNWATAYLVEWRDGFPFSIQNDDGILLESINSRRFPMFFELNLHVERRFFFRGHRWAFRAGFNNLTNHKNPAVVNSNVSSPNFLRFYGGSGRALNFRIRWLGKQ